MIIAYFNLKDPDVWERRDYRMKKHLYLLFFLLLLLVTGCANNTTPKAPAKPAADTPGQTLNLFSWADNFDPEVLSAFEKQYNCKINYDVFANNEELLAKIQAGGSSYDVIQPSDYMVATMIKLNLLEELDSKSLTNTKNIIASLRAPKYDPDGKYSVVYTWGVTGIAYNKKFVKDTPTSWNDLWNPAYKGRLILLNDNREILGMALKKHGFSNNSTNPQELKIAVADLRKLMPNVLAFDTDTIKQKFIAEEAWIGTMWSGDAYFTYKDNKNIGFIVPKEGATIWADTFAIPKGSKNKVLAEKFINYMYDPKVSAKNYEFIGYNDPNEQSAKYHSEEYNNDPFLKTAKDYITKGEWLEDIGDALPMYDKSWTELKTGK
jgi:spermidine/putrescine transport system substrate-binding protein